MGFLDVGVTDAEESTEVMDTVMLLFPPTESPSLLQSCRRASSFMDIIKVQSYEPLEWEDICHTKHWN